MTAGQITFILFLLVVVVYLAYFIVQMVKRPEPEHFTLPEPTQTTSATTKDCKAYNLRQEVMNIFDIYLKRKPAVDEIRKYSALGNEQDILVAIINDFQIANTEVEEKKPQLDDMRVDSCGVVVVQPEENFYGASIYDVEDEETALEPFTENNKSAEFITIPAKLYDELKSKVQEIERYVTNNI